MDSAAPQAAAVARAASAATNGSAAADDGGAALLDNVGSLLRLVSEAGADGAAQQGKWVAQVNLIKEQLSMQYRSVAGVPGTKCTPAQLEQRIQRVNGRQSVVDDRLTRCVAMLDELLADAPEPAAGPVASEAQ